MSFALFQRTLLLPIETALNALLALDPLTATRLRPFEGQILAVRPTDAPLEIYVAIRNGKLSLSPVSGAIPNAVLTGPSLSLLTLAARGGKAHNLHGTGVSLEGSTTLVGGLREVISELDVDWEYHLSRFTGDLPASALGRAAESASSTVARSGTRLRDDFSDYLTQESGLTPHRLEVEAFYSASRELDLRLDRLEARLAALSGQH
jgi:ubiquinone biosynthesis protein UbiJ